MKKFLSIILCLTFILSCLAGCAKNETKETETSRESNIEETPTKPNTEETQPETEPEPEPETDEKYFISEGSVVKGLTEEGKALDEINIPEKINGETITEIGKYAFQKCAHIKKVQIPKTVKIIGDYAFVDCIRLENVRILPGSESIGMGAFYCCEKLKNIEIPDTVTKIDMLAFVECKNLESIDIPDSVTYIGENSFIACLSLQHVKISNSMDTIKEALFFNCVKIEKIVIPDSVKVIEGSAFAMNKGLISVVIPENIQMIQDLAFSSCDKLHDIFYKGTKQQWENINIFEEGNENLFESVVYFYSEEKPTEKGNFWHCVDGEAVKWNEGTIPDETKPETKPETEPETDSKDPEPEIKTWQDYAASAFESGNGTQNSPYVIKTPEQLAFFAKEVNSGKTFKNKYVCLNSDIDLKNIEWIPIGNGENSFDGNFDGCNHKISNLRITKNHIFKELIGIRYHYMDVKGLFGLCVDAIIKNLKVDTAYIEFVNSNNFFRVYGGCVVGKYRATSKSHMENISSENAVIKEIYDADNPGTVYDDASLRIYGGIIGNIDIQKNASFKLSSVQSRVTFDSTKEQGLYYYTNGGIIGYVFSYGTFEITDFASYINDLMSTKTKNGSTGAIGFLGYIKGINKISNGYSEVKINRLPQKIDLCNEIKASAILGLLSSGGKNDTGTVELENLFGSVKPYGEVEDFKKPILEIVYYENEYNKLNVIKNINCKGCEVLPESCGFDKNIWDLSDMSNPKIK